jgi:hypothetical protein
MKTLMAAVVVSALALGGIAAGQAPPVETPRPATPKKMTMEDLGKILEGLGLEPKPYKNADGVVTGYAVVYTRGQDRLTLSVSLSPSGTNVWLQAGMLQFNEKEPATANVLLALLAKHNEMWPAYADHTPKSGWVFLSMPVQGPNFTPASLRTGLDTFMDKFIIFREAYQKAKKEETKTQTPTPLP